MAEEIKEKVELTVDQIKQDLKDGVSRKQMQEKYGLKRADIMRIFKHEDLKGLKVHTPGQKKTRRRSEPSFILKDSTGNDVTSQVFSATSATPTVEGYKAVLPSNQQKAEAQTASKPLVTESSKW